MSNIISYILCFAWLPMLLLGLLGLLLGWLLWGRIKHQGDLTIEGEGALRAEADGLRARVRELEGRVSTRDSEVSGLKTKLAAATTGAAAVGVATAASAKASEGDDDETYALEWRNRYLAARVKYLESRVSDAPKAKPAPKKKAAPKAKAKAAAPKAKSAPKASAAPASKPKVLYTEGPTDGDPDDLKRIKGIGPKFEGDLNNKGIYYFRQIGAWKANDVKMVEGIIDSIPGRIKRDEWVPQAKRLAKGGSGNSMSSKTRSSASSKSGTAKKKAPKKSDSEVAFDKYYANVKKFDKNANEDVVRNIVKYCGIALRTRDGSLVACSDESEVQRVADGFVTKKLGMNTGQLELVKDICTEMKPQRFKNRVTFYYLAAKKVGKLSIFEG